MIDPLLYPICFMQMFLEGLRAFAANIANEAAEADKWAHRAAIAAIGCSALPIAATVVGELSILNNWPPAWLHPI